MSVIHRVRSVFWNPEERRLRALWRLVLWTVVYVLGALGVGVLLSRSGPGGWLSGGPATNRTVSVALNAAVVVVAVGVAAVALDRRRFADYGFDLDRGWWLDLGFGLLLGAALMTGIFLLELALGWIRVTDTFVATGSLGFAAGFALVLVTFLLVGVYEELLTRGYILTNVAEGLRLSWPVEVGRAPAVAAATLLSSALFGLLHAANPNATLLSSVTIGVAGVLLALGYVLTGDLAIPIGLHVTWNLFQGAVYGFPVSGIDLGVAVVAVEQRGPALVTGGRFGPEAGLVGLAAMGVGALAILGYVRARGGDLSLAPVDVPALRWR